MITEFKLFEGKQIGILYHYTEFPALEKILRTDKMTSPIYGYISFSRNSHLNFYNSAIKIIFDGDKMSEKFKIVPHLYKGDVNYKEEAEMRIKCKRDDSSENGSISGIKKYIIGIEIFTQKEYDNDIENRLKIIDELLPNVKVTIKPFPTYRKNN
jgi:hypothetical protein